MHKMFNRRNLRKLIAIAVIVAFTFQFQGAGILFSQEVDEVAGLFRDAKELYDNNRLTDAKDKVEKLIKLIEDLAPDRKDILGKCHLLLGVISEKEGEEESAIEHYRKAKEEYNTETIEGVVFENLPLYRMNVTGESNVIPMVGDKPDKEKKNFPILLVVGGIALVVVLVLVLGKKKKDKKQYTLSVTRGDGVDGSPSTSTMYDEGAIVNYDYRLQSGYSNLVVMLDGAEVSSNGRIVMDRNHTLTANAGANEVSFVVEPNELTIAEGSTAIFNLSLSAEPAENVEVTVFKESGDDSITILSGSKLNFTTSDWGIAQEIKLNASEDADSSNDRADFAIEASGIPKKTVTVVVLDNDSEDTRPEVSITKPSNGATVSGDVLIQADAWDDNGIRRVEFYIDGNPVYSDKSAPFEYTWDSTKESNATHFIKVVAFDNENQSVKDEILVTVNNGG